MELLYVLLAAVALLLLWQGVRGYRAWRSRLRLKLEPVPPGPDIDEIEVHRELGPVRVRPRQSPSFAEPVLPATPPAPPVEAELPAPDTAPSAPPALEDDLPVVITPAQVALPEPEPEIVQPDLFGDEPIAPPPRRGQGASRARTLYETPAVEPVRAVPAEPAVAVGEIQQVIALHVVAREHLFRGEDLLRCLLAYGLRYGEMSIFHRHEQPTGQGRVLFSMAKAVEPGTFDLEAMTTEDMPGVTFFLGLPGVNSIAAWDLMVDTARRLAHELHGEVLDEQQQPLSRQLVEHYRERVQEFERRRLMDKGR
ncbi:MAG: cell division protein ZipA [Moraxellaceae bacterium]